MAERGQVGVFSAEMKTWEESNRRSPGAYMKQSLSVWVKTPETWK